MKRTLAIGLTAVFSLSILAACGSDDDNDTVADVQDANSAYCQDLGAYGASLAAFAALDPTTATKAEYQDAAGAVKSARTDLASSGVDLTEAEVANLKAQAEQLDGALTDASDDAVVADIVTAAQTQVTAVQASAAAVNTAVCTGANVTTEGT